ncbi:MAG TPA: DUF4159 domain-containing protein [Phycisphaerae bacterium]|nr:DUF4159 domain-containing protein [Phycisphaerae bacterium]
MTRMLARRLLVVVVAVSLVAPALGWDNPKQMPPRPKPQRVGAGEGIPPGGPLPGPVTPIRRAEKKRPPAVPALVGMIFFSARASIVDGERRPAEVVPTTQIDIERLMNFANQRLKIHYRYVRCTFDQFSWDPAELPVLYLTGWTPLPDFGDALRRRIRRYLYDGGTLVMHAQCGREEFIHSARQQIARLFPHRQLAPLDTDSPLFHAHYRIGRMRFRRDTGPFESIPPYIEAVHLGCRPAVILSPIDLNCGWDVEKRPIQGGILYHQDDACELGVNLLAAALANFQYARAWGTQKVYHQQRDATRDQLVIAQVAHNGDWDPTPHALPNLMKYIRANTTLNVQFKRKVVDSFGDVDMLKHPALYVTGLRDFQLSEAEVLRLRTYLQSGGVLIADAAAGMKAFDVAFRREIRRVLPKAELKLLPVTSPVYQVPYKVRQVSYTSLVKAQTPDLNAPTLEAITIDGQLAVIYSPFSLSNGWEQLAFAYNRGYADTDALRLGVNILTHALTH